MNCYWQNARNVSAIIRNACPLLEFSMSPLLEMPVTQTKPF